MKYLLIILFSATSFMGCTTTTNQNNETEAIVQVLNKQVEEWNKGNIDGYMMGYWNSDSLLFIGRRGPKYGYDTTLVNYKKAYPNAEAMGKLSFSGLSFKKLSDEYYYVMGGWHLEKNNEAGGYFTLLFRKVDDRWVIVADHTS